MKMMFSFFLAVLVSAVSLCDASAGGLSLNGEGVVYDAGPSGSFTLTYPVLVNASGKNIKIMDKSVAGRKATVKYEGGGQMNLELGNGEFFLKFSGVPKGIAKINSTMQINAEYNRGGKWMIGGGEAREFTKEKPSKPFLYKGNAKDF